MRARACVCVCALARLFLFLSDCVDSLLSSPSSLSLYLSVSVSNTACFVVLFVHNVRKDSVVKLNRSFAHFENSAP